MRVIKSSCTQHTTRAPRLWSWGTGAQSAGNGPVSLIAPRKLGRKSPEAPGSPPLPSPAIFFQRRPTRHSPALLPHPHRHGAVPALEPSADRLPRGTATDVKWRELAGKWEPRGWECARVAAASPGLSDPQFPPLQGGTPTPPTSDELTTRSLTPHPPPEHARQFPRVGAPSQDGENQDQRNRTRDWGPRRRTEGTLTRLAWEEHRAARPRVSYEQARPRKGRAASSVRGPAVWTRGGGGAEISGALRKAAGDPPPCNRPYRDHRAVSHNPKMSLWAGVGHQGAAEACPALGSPQPSPVSPVPMGPSDPTLLHPLEWGPEPSVPEEHRVEPRQDAPR